MLRAYETFFVPFATLVHCVWVAGPQLCDAPPLLLSGKDKRERVSFIEEWENTLPFRF
jgi:hypothetical protein